MALSDIRIFGGLRSFGGGDGVVSACDHKSWDDNKQNYDFSGEEGPWDYRYKNLLSIMSNNTRSVMDLGAGNMSLHRLLPNSIKYYPVDVEKTYEETIVCDLNAGCFPNIKIDVIFCCGILEYILPEKMQQVINWICKHSKEALVSYNSVRQIGDVIQRMNAGWKNHFNVGELISFFNKAGFSVTEELYTDNIESYLKFNKRFRLLF